MSYQAMNTPPREWLADYLPELLARHDAVRAAEKAAQNARTVVKASESPAPGQSGGGAYRAAVKADDELVDAGRPAKHVAELAGQRLYLEGQALALARRATRLTDEWNATARTEAEKSRRRLLKGELEARTTCYELARRALAAEQDGDHRGVRVELGSLEDALDAWREVCSVVRWLVGPSGLSGNEWRLTRTTLPRDPEATPEARRRNAVTEVEDALAIVDEVRRRQHEYRHRVSGQELSGGPRARLAGGGRS